MLHPCFWSDPRCPPDGRVATNRPLVAGPYRCLDLAKEKDFMVLFAQSICGMSGKVRVCLDPLVMLKKGEMDPII